MKDYDAEILGLENKKQALLLQMEPLAVTFREAVAPFLASFYEERAKGEVTRQTEITTSLGKDRISALKQSVSDLQQNAPAIVDQFLGEDSIWWHKSNQDSSNHEPTYGYYGHRAPDVLDKPVRLAAGRLAPLLEECGYLQTGGREHGVWREWDRSGNHHPHNARPYYPNSLDWSPRMRDIINEYDKLVKEGRHLSQRIALLLREKQKMQAQDLWDSA